jgi:cation:H+ antiporter
MLILATLTLWLGSDSLIYGSKSLALIAGVPEELIGFTLLAIGTSLPELAASISLIRKAQTSMLLGNIVGSNLFNLSLIGGLAGVLGPIYSGAPYPWIDYLSLILTTGVLIYWLGGKNLVKNHGLTLLCLYFLASISTWLLNS